MTRLLTALFTTVLVCMIAVTWRASLDLATAKLRPPPAP